MPVAKKRKAHDDQTLPPTASSPALLAGGSDQTLRRLTLGFAVLGWLLADIRASFGKLVDVSPFQYVALQAIARVARDEPWTMRALAQHFRVTNAFVSMEIRPLIEKGLLAAQPSPDDRRVKFLTLSPKGVQALTDLAPVQQKVNDMLYAQFDAKTLALQCQTIEQMIKDAEQANQYLKQRLSNRAIEQ